MKIEGVHSTGVQQDITAKHKADLPKPVAGEHYWVVTAAWFVRDPAKIAGQQFHMDMENLLTVDGPGCFHCGEMYSEAAAATPCAGDICR